jgi:hypothetical protein
METGKKLRIAVAAPMITSSPGLDGYHGLQLPDGSTAGASVSYCNTAFRSHVNSLTDNTGQHSNKHEAEDG